jgi:hypothetical protein
VITLLAMSKSQARHLQEIGFLIGAIGGLFLVIAAVLGLMEFSRRSELGLVLVSGILLIVGFVLALIGIHGGL